jgi:hypothetical protein
MGQKNRTLAARSTGLSALPSCKTGRGRAGAERLWTDRPGCGVGVLGYRIIFGVLYIYTHDNTILHVKCSVYSTPNNQITNRTD